MFNLPRIFSTGLLATSVLFVPPNLWAHHLLPQDITDRLDDHTLESIETYIEIALDTVPDAGIQPWYSANGQAYGEINILRSFEFNGVNCREAQITIKVENHTDQRSFNFCQQDLQWLPLSYK